MLEVIICDSHLAACVVDFIWYVVCNTEYRILLIG